MEDKKRIICARCGGRMVLEDFYGPNEKYSGLRCLTCGDVIDPTILVHRFTKNHGVDITKLPWNTKRRAQKDFNKYVSEKGGKVDTKT